MNVSATIPPTVQIKRGRLFGLIAAIAALAAALTWAVLAFAVDTGGENVQAGATSVAAISGAGALDAQQAANQVNSLTPAERSVGNYLFGTSDSLTPAQGQSIRDYLVGASSPLAPAERSVGNYLFGTSDSLTPVQLRSVRNYFLGASSSVTPVERSVGNYLFGASDSLTPAQLRSIRNYLFGASATTGVSARGS